MKTAIYPGSFNPWHDGHSDVLDKALQVFDKVIIAVGQNSNKPELDLYSASSMIPDKIQANPRVIITTFHKFLIHHINAINMPVHAIIRGLRNGQDLENERVQQYYNEDLAIVAGVHLPPTVYFVTNRNLLHVSSSAIRAIEKIKQTSTVVTPQSGKMCSCGAKKP